MPRRLAVFDTSIYVPYYRGEAYRDYVRTETLRGRVRFSSVVLQELYAGTRSPRDKRDLDIVEGVFRRRAFLLTPQHQDWLTAGQAISRYIRNHGAIDPRDHINDILILLCAVRANARVVTENIDHFSIWSRQIRSMGFKAEIEQVVRKDFID